jgi:hypothetical protein
MNKKKKRDPILNLMSITSLLTVFGFFKRVFPEPFSFGIPLVILLPSLIYVILNAVKNGKAEGAND